MSKHVVFDLDGTLIDSAPSILECLELALTQNSISPAIPLSNELIGPPLDVTLKKITGIEDPILIATLINSFRHAYDAVGYMRSEPYGGVTDMLHRLRAAGVFLHLATNKRIIPTRKILDYLRWHHLFHSVYALDIGAIKYDSKADMLESMLEEQKLDPFTTIYVGDINADYEASKKSGLQFIFAEWGYERKGGFQYFPSASNVHDLTDKILG